MFLLGRLETSDDFKVSEKKKEPVENKTSEIDDLKITVRLLTSEDIKTRKLPNQIKGVVVTKINNDSPLKNTTLAVNHIITEAQKKKIRSIDDLKKVVQQVISLKSKYDFIGNI
jgi:serine protease Do